MSPTSLGMCVRSNLLLRVELYIAEKLPQIKAAGRRTLCRWFGRFASFRVMALLCKRTILGNALRNSGKCTLGMWLSQKRIVLPHWGWACAIHLKLSRSFRISLHQKYHFSEFVVIYSLDNNFLRLILPMGGFPCWKTCAGTWGAEPHSKRWD